jgi:arabinan endo-1,5-alpha-L-arabinosidase
LGNGIYEISASESNLLARITDCMGNAGAKLSINQPLSQDCEIWMIDRTNDVRYIFTSLYGNKVIEVPESSLEEGIHLEMNNYSGAANQKWMIRDTSYAVFAAGPEISQGNIRIFPNPSPSGSFYIETDQSSGICEVVIYSLAGQKIISKELPVSQRINVKNTLIPGFYLVKIKINPYIFTSKLTVH